MPIALTLFLFFSAPGVHILRDMNPDHRPPTGFRVWRGGTTEPNFWHSEQLDRRGGAFDPRVAIIVESSLVAPLRAPLDTLMNDLILEGYQVATYSVRGLNCESLRALLQREYQTGLTSALLIGNLPIAWFQLIDDWNGNGRRDPDEGYEEFPCDLYLMDLDGTWEDRWVRYDTFDSLIPGCDSIYDTHSGSIQPEIGISRLYASTVGNELPLLRAYLARCHAYRTGNLRVTERALVYIDDDWVPWATEWNNQVGYLYPPRVFIADSEATRVRDYQPRIDTAAYQWIQLCAHSWPGGHAMRYNRGQNWDWFYAESIPRLNPQACFYNLFACSNVRFTEPGYCGGRYVFESSTGLAAIGSTKTGSMLEFGDFYGPLATGAPLAEAFREWFARQASNGFEPWEIAWFYGMTLIGDGLLKPRSPVAVSESPRSGPRAIKFCTPTIVRNTVTLSTPATLFDPGGRKLAKLNFGASSLRSLRSGVYFLLPENSPSASAITVIN